MSESRPKKKRPMLRVVGGPFDGQLKRAPETPSALVIRPVDPADPVLVYLLERQSVNGGPEELVWAWCSDVSS